MRRIRAWITVGVALAVAGCGGGGGGGSTRTVTGKAPMPRPAVPGSVLLDLPSGTRPVVLPVAQALGETALVPIEDGLDTRFDDRMLHVALPEGCGTATVSVSGVDRAPEPDAAAAAESFARRGFDGGGERLAGSDLGRDRFGRPLAWAQLSSPANGRLGLATVSVARDRAGDLALVVTANPLLKTCTSKEVGEVAGIAAGIAVGWRSTPPPFRPAAAGGDINAQLADAAIRRFSGETERAVLARRVDLAFDAPAGYAIGYRDAGNDLHRFVPASDRRGDGREAISLLSYGGSGDAKDKLLTLGLLRARYRSDFQDVSRLLSRPGERHAGVPMAVIDDADDLDGQSFRERTWLFVITQRPYTLACSAPPERFDTVVATCRKLLGSIDPG